MCAKKQGKAKVSYTLDAQVYAWLKAKSVELDRSMSWIINDMLKSKMSKE